MNSDEFKEQLSQILEVMNLDKIIIYIDDRDNISSSTLLTQLNSDIKNIIIQLNSDIKQITISGIYENLDLFDITPDDFKKLQYCEKIFVRKLKTKQLTKQLHRNKKDCINI